MSDTASTQEHDNPGHAAPVLAAWLIRPVPQGFEPSTSPFKSSRVA